MKKLLTLTFFTICFINLIAQNSLRESVVIVRPTHAPSTVKFLNDYSKSLDRQGYKNAANLLKSYAKGGFGSGFIYTDTKTGKSYVVTNRHVVAQADSVTIEVQVPEKPTQKYSGCFIIAADEQLDLALIALPDDININTNITIINKVPEDGAEVFTAGYPGLGSDPSWQLGHGIISNRAIYNKVLTGTDSVSVIQHTAQIDAGSSGGPLLVRKASGGYDIIGINTWKAEGRENVNFAISGTSINSFLKEHMNNQNRTDKKSLEKRAKGFVKAVNSKYQDVLPYISSEYISNVSVNAFMDLLNAITDSVRTDVIYCFNNGRPVDGVRIALAEAIRMKFSDKNMTYSSMEEGTNQPISVMLASGEKYLPTEWVIEQGDWRIQKIAALKLNDLESKGISKHFGYPGSIKLGMDIPINSDIEGTQFRLALDKTFLTFVTYGVSFGIGSMTLDKEEFNGTAYDAISVNKKYFSTDVSLGLQLPVKVSRLYIVPHVKGIGGFNMGEDTGGIYYGFSIGSEVAYKLTNRTYLVGGLDFKRRFYSSQDYDFGGEDNAKFPGYSSLGFYLGITW